MLAQEVIAMLCCPEDRSALVPAERAILDDVNAAIRSGRVRNRAGKPVEQALDGGLVRADRRVMYPIVDEIPVLVRDEGIALDQIQK